MKTILFFVLVFGLTSPSWAITGCKVSKVRRLNVSDGVLVTLGECRSPSFPRFDIRELRIVGEAVEQLTSLATAALIGNLPVTIDYESAHAEVIQDLGSVKIYRLNGYTAFEIASASH